MRLFRRRRCTLTSLILKMMLHETNGNDDLYGNTALQHYCDIVSNGYNIVPTLQRYVALKIVVTESSRVNITFKQVLLGRLRACLHGGGGPQVGEVKYGGSPHLSCKRDQIKMRDYMDKRVTPPKRVTSPTWGPPPPCKQALISSMYRFGRRIYSIESFIDFFKSLKL